MTPEEAGLDTREWEELKSALRREPNDLELRMVGVMWSEHCSYKSTRSLLAALPKDGPYVVSGEGENAGVVRLNEKLGLAFKVESHNHPSAVSPYEGAATGVGGIIRDILAMGARPIASMDGLFFGSSDTPRNRRISSGVVRGIGGYGNPVGVPTVGGLTIYDQCYDDNPLVNAFCAGILSLDKACSSKTAKPGMQVLILGAKTGRDGIAGAAFASTGLSGDDEANKPQIQIGDPFYEKLLIEACLELLDGGTIQAMQDMGAAGILSSTSEVAHKSGNGIDIHCDRIPLREAMEPWEIFLSESQERMLLVCMPEDIPSVKAVAKKWNLECAVVGEMTDTGLYRVFNRGELIAELPVGLLGGDSPLKNWPSTPPQRSTSVRASRNLSPEDAITEILRLMKHPCMGDHSWIYRQYDSMVQLRTLLGPGNPVAALWIEGAGTVVFSMEANPWMCAQDPFVGTALITALSIRHLSVAGADPMGITNCLNFPSPEIPKQYWELEESVKGLSIAARELKCPVISGNVSLYNESPSSRIMPSPLVVSAGIVPEGTALLRPKPDPSGDEPEVFLVGRSTSTVGSLYGHMAGACGSTLSFDPSREMAFNRCAIKAAKEGIANAGRAVSRGGWAASLIKTIINSPFGVDLDVPWPMDEADIFGEGSPSAIYFVSPERARDLESVFNGHEVRHIGTLTRRHRSLKAGKTSIPLKNLRGGEKI
ncbi:MAG: phosphoribosylformylglycinamidine synthase subunit PurL [Thermanaerothrix sp.]|nr:phosphoribosylformylglycinamidine synthase subunit PurL [Thermanaerothrix sp.]